MRCLEYCVIVKLREVTRISQDMNITAHEKRHWVRLTYACNNRCVFCHDSIVQSGEMVAPDILEKQISEGIDSGARRLILSGGEPTIHPDFLDMIALGKKLGYRWVQVVSNGRMFAYSSFAKSAIEAGLDEATFSLHGHTAELHDSLVGTRGAFAQSLKGLDNLIGYKIAVLSVDIVLTSLNFPLLPEILDFYLKKGIREFDLLWLVPFGRAWEDRKDLFLSPHRGSEILRRAVDLARTHGAVLWTNRLPASMLEGMEDLIQDPGKIHDEVRGRRPKFQMLIDDGVELPCKQLERCELCFMNQFCKELDSLLLQHRQGVYEVLSLYLEKGKIPTGPWSKAKRLYIRGETCEQVASFVKTMSNWHGEVICQPYEIPKKDPMELDWAGASLLRLASGTPEVLDRLLEFRSASVEIIVNKGSAKWLETNARKLAPYPKPLFVSFQRFLDMEEAGLHGVDPVHALS